MPSIRRILVAIKNPAARSLPAVQKAAQLARGMRARVILFHGLADPVYIESPEAGAPPFAEAQEAQRQAQLRRLESLAAKLRRSGIQASSVVEWDYPAHEAVLRQAAKTRADLIIAEAHPTRQHAAWLLRFTDWELVRRSPVPVLLVRSIRPYRRPAVLAAVDPLHAFAKPAKLDRQILRQASIVSKALGGVLHAVYAYDPMPVGLDGAQLISAEAIESVRRSTLERAQAALTRAVRASHIAPARRHLVGRHPVDAIIETAEELGCGLLVMGAISRSGLKRLLLGDTAERIIDRLSCDVLIVKPAHFASRIARATRGARIIAWPVTAPGL